LENEKRNNDERDYGIGAQIIRALNVSKMKLISSSQIKRSALEGYGLEITEYITL
jgi:3,4-dihydroxy 2-butanone 4-phosphate synthase/GTP cyclohydrolase II